MNTVRMFFIAALLAHMTLWGVSVVRAETNPPASTADATAKTENAETCSAKNGGSTTTEAKSVDSALKQTDKTSNDTVQVSAEGKVSITSKCNPKCIGDKLKDAKGNASSTPCPAGTVTMELPNGVKVTCSKEKESCGKAVQAAATSKEVLDAIKTGDLDKAGKLFAEKIASDPGFKSAISSAEQSILNSAFTENLPDDLKAAGETLQQSTADMLKALGDGNFSEIKNIAERVQKDPAIQQLLKDPNNIARLAGQYLPQEAKQAVNGMTDAVCALAGSQNCAQLKQFTSSLTGGSGGAGSGNSGAPFVQYDRKYGLPDGTLAKIAKIEAGCGVKSTLSSAAGCFQWTTGSWKSVTKQLYGKELPLSARYDANTSAEVTAAYLSQMNNKYSSLISQTGLGAPVALYMIHNLGEGSGTKFLKAYAANPGMSVGNVLSSIEIRNNRSLYTVTTSGGSYTTTLAGAVRNISSKMGSGISSVPQGSPFSIAQASFSNILGNGYSGGGTSGNYSGYSNSSAVGYGGGTSNSGSNSILSWLSNLLSGRPSGTSGSGTASQSINSTQPGETNTVLGPTTSNNPQVTTDTVSTTPIEVPSISFTASPTSAQKGDSFLLIWTATGVSSTAPCIVKDDQDKTLAQANAGSYVGQIPVSTSNAALPFTLVCVARDSRVTASQDTTRTAIILVQ